MSDNANQNLQDPLPESNWLWRRVFCFAVVAVLLFFMWGAMDRIGKVATSLPEKGIPALVTMGKWIIGFAGTVVTYYLLAPSAEQITKMMKTASLLKSGVQMASKAVTRTPERVEETSVAAGRPIPQPGASPAPPEPPVVPDVPESPPEASSGTYEGDDEPARTPPVGIPDQK